LFALSAVGLSLTVYFSLDYLRANREWGRAEAALRRHDLDSAANHLDDYLATRPADASGWFLAARTARRRERFPEASRDLERCQEIGGVTEATRLEWDLIRVQQGEMAGIDVRLRSTIQADHPDALLVLEALARGYMRIERLFDALEACNLWIARQPEHPWPFLWRGAIYERLSHFERALADFQRAVQNAPEDREARLALAGSLLRQRQPNAAAEHFEILVARDADDELALTGLAGCRVEQGRSAEAIPLLERALQLNARSTQALFLRGKVALEQDQPAKAVPWLREAIRLSPYDAEALHQLAQALRPLGQTDEAARLSRRADELRLGFTRFDELVRQVARKSDDGKLRHEVGVLALQLGRTEEGVRWLKSVLTLKGEHSATHAALAEYYEKAGERELAQHHRLLIKAP